MLESASIIPRLKKVLQEVHGGEHPHIPNPPLCKKRASVALILRVRPTVSDKAEWSSDASHPYILSFTDSLTKFFDQEWVRRGDPEILFIKRAVRSGDRWTGHVAFPGGKREPSDADDRAAASRETREEVGIDLETDHCLFIGKLPERVITTNWGKVPIMVLCPFVYLLLRHDIPPLALQPTEVHSTHWVPFRGLLSAALRTTVTADISDRLKKQRGPSMKHLVRAVLGRLVFSATVLTPSESLYCTTVPSFIPEDRAPSNLRFNVLDLVSLIFNQQPQVGGPHILWGLTLGITTEFLNQIDPEATSTLCSWPTFSHWDIRLILWILTYRLRTKHSKEYDDRPAIESEHEGAAFTVNGIDDTTFAASTWRPGPAAAQFPDEYFSLMRKAVVSSLLLRSNIFVILAIMAIVRFRRRSLRL